MKLTSRLAPLALAALLAAAGVQAQEKVLGEGQITQQALIDALAPAVAPPAVPAGAEAASAAEGGASAPRMRGFRPTLRATAAVGSSAAVAAPPARASILVTFISNSAELSGAARNALDVLAGAMKSERLAKVRFTIEGHADPRGGDELNLRLSQSRADSVRQYLVASHALAADRITAVGKGATALMNTADPAAPENRRVTIVAQP